ncbi:hypothetical protein AQV86_00170 [Nanohaloarchaea archaeon SG9]|nr:hypothetical protein AQV86_00170 [Nanohaloarchaea archaeon SG9]
MEPEEQIDQFNKEAAEHVEQLTETITQVEQSLQDDREPEEEIEQLHRDYRDLSKKRVYFKAENTNFRKTLRPLENPTKKNYGENRGLEAHKPDLLDHKKHLDTEKNTAMKEAEHLYQRYRQEKGLKPVKHELDIPATLEELEGLREGKELKIHAMRDYLEDLRKIENGEKTVEETEYHLPDNSELIDQQIQTTAQKIYQEWETIKQKQETVKQAFQQLKQEKDELKPLEIGIKYGLRPVESTYEGVERDIDDITSQWNSLAQSFTQHLPETYEQRINRKASA